jgi:glycogen(starch) synthase
MRVLFWSETFWPVIGGAQLAAENLLLALQERGHRFIVITRRDSADLPQEAAFKGIPVYRFPFCSAYVRGDIGQVARARKEVARLKRTFAPELVHISGFGPSVLFHLETSHAHPAPSLMTLHGERYKEVVGGDTLQERVLRSAGWVAGCSAALLENARRLAPEITRRSSIIRNALPSPGLLPMPLPSTAPRLLCLGRLVREKGFDLALKALAAVLPRFPYVRLIIAGDGPERPALQRQTVELGLESFVEFTGWVAREDVPALMNQAVALVMPSRREGLPLVALEAAQMARPVIAARVGGLPEIVAHGQTGLLVDREDVAGLARAFSLLLENPELAVRLGRTARERVQTEFSWNVHVDSYERLYLRLSARSGGLRRRTDA